MSGVTLELDEDLVAVLREQDQPLERAALEVIVMDLHRRALISRGKAAELLGLPLLDFIRRAAEFGIPYFNFSREELEAEIAASKKL